ncbi:hypothetical protein BKA69DRAFT_1126319 [Paraphysoderma sedebokerense]|nr:hypothetical protein BKA69DRAFT_1126319 [Paraphysoderma sedebokerense]
MPAVPPDCWQAFIRCVAMRGVYDDQTLGMCGHLMSICSDRGGRWPFGNDSSISWEQPYTNDTLQIYRNLYYYRREAETWLNLTVFHPLCRKLMGQCVEASGGPASDVVIGRCGNQMGRCTFENIFLPHSYDGTNIYTTDYDRMWQRYSNIINPIFRWQDVTRFSFFCTDQFYGCVFASGGPSSDAAIGICGNRMSLCTFNDNNWPTISNPSTPFQTEPYDARLPLYRSMFEFMVPNVTSYSTFLALQILPNTTILPASTILSSRHHSAITTLLPGANFTLKFRGTRDGWSAQKFRTMCNGTAPNFAVFRTTMNFIFTAYSPIAFTTANSGTPDISFYRSAPEDSTWLNNLESNTGAISTSKFFNKQPQYTIFDANSMGPTYGYGHDIRTRDPMNINGTASEDTFKGSSYLAGASNFNLTEMEFYHVTMVA